MERDLRRDEQPDEAPSPETARDAGLRVPGATYRLQLTKDAGFAHAAELVPYLHELGVTDLYLSPIFKARSGSPHGYDVTDPTALNVELGSEADFAALVAACRERGMGILLDIVPNHMAVSHESPWWWDVLAKGERSRFAKVFDVDWHPRRRALDGKVLLPVLGDSYGTILERGELVVKDGTLHYWDRSLPLRGPIPERVNGKKGDPRSWDALDALLRRQAYRLAHWKTATPEINYRRFFDINDLIGVRVEDEAVFELTHALVLRLAREGLVTGLRVDHVDGLRDPKRYLERLRAALPGPYYVVVEKILTGDELLPGDWPVAGTTGYDWLKVTNGIFADDHGVQDLDSLYKSFTGHDESFGELVWRMKERVLEELFPGELANLVERLHALADGDRHACDLGERALREALAAVTASLPVYRSYVSGGEVDPASRATIAQALAEARARCPECDAAAFEFLERVLTLRIANADEFVARWQQLTGPVMAKGLEDTAFYIYTRLLSLNDIGARRSRARSLGDFHRFNAIRAERWPHAMSATSTHDTKRSEDVRARLHVLSELAHEWGQCVPRWSRWNRDKKRRVHGRLVPDPNEEMLLYQTLVGAWPLEPGPLDPFRERVKAYVLKAVKEAKVHTSWTSPDAAHEAALLAFVDAVFAAPRFLRDLQRFERRVAFYGAWSSLAQVVLKIGSPGVPDFYQGSELWDLSLVDPDNRRPVDFEHRARLLEEQREGPGFVDALLDSWSDGRVKLFVTRKGLAFRARHRAIFEQGDYLPLRATGRMKDHVCAFARRHGGEWVVVAAPRLIAGLVPDGTLPVGEKAWPQGALTLPADAPRRWRNVFTGEAVGRLALRDVFRRCPVAILHSERANVEA